MLGQAFASCHVTTGDRIVRELLNIDRHGRNARPLAAVTGPEGRLASPTSASFLRVRQRSTAIQAMERGRGDGPGCSRGPAGATGGSDPPRGGRSAGGNCDGGGSSVDGPGGSFIGQGGGPGVVSYGIDNGADPPPGREYGSEGEKGSARSSNRRVSAYRRPLHRLKSVTPRKSLAVSVSLSLPGFVLHSEWMPGNAGVLLTIGSALNASQQ